MGSRLSLCTSAVNVSDHQNRKDGDGSFTGQITVIIWKHTVRDMRRSFIYCSKYSLVLVIAYLHQQCIVHTFRNCSMCACMSVNVRQWRSYRQRGFEAPTNPTYRFNNSLSLSSISIIISPLYHLSHKGNPTNIYHPWVQK